MNHLLKMADTACISIKSHMLCKREAVDQIIVMFIVIAVAAGLAGLLYVYGTGTLLPAFENKLTTLINGWFDHT